ncbi:MAG: 4-hydroxythreonine-4-phosphate dehydrogenase PdxA [Leptolyngbyaceae bacterium]|nr:4-hydroxythreonine-4-phosphate dehydrogenase PdxA [Leptolyngbyaceae bacterium]
MPLSSQFASGDRPALAISFGDPAGIGIEVVLKALADVDLLDKANLTVVGNRDILYNTYDRLKAQSPDMAIAHPDDISILDIDFPETLLANLTVGEGNHASGEVGCQCLHQAIAHTVAGTFDGIVTAPIAKSAWKAAGHHYPGQTELLAEQSHTEQFGMMFVARSPHTGWVLRTLLATTHIPLRAVPTALTADILTQKLDLLMATLQRDFGMTAPRIAVAGLNPHSGELGQLGREEQDWMMTWFKEMGDRHPTLTLDGPIPPDTMWVRPGQAWFGTRQSVNTHDAYLALYHDQGLIPVKLMGFDRAINTTIGLTFVRTSPDHGTAFDIAGKGIADATSMKEAILWAVELVRQRKTAAVVR